MKIQTEFSQQSVDPHQSSGSPLEWKLQNPLRNKVEVSGHFQSLSGYYTWVNAAFSQKYKRFHHNLLLFPASIPFFRFHGLFYNTCNICRSNIEALSHTKSK